MSLGAALSCGGRPGQQVKPGIQRSLPCREDAVLSPEHLGEFLNSSHAWHFSFMRELDRSSIPVFPRRKSGIFIPRLTAGCHASGRAV
jgi:hypothetical protein